jgi:hypothetical protein
MASCTAPVRGHSSAAAAAACPACRYRTSYRSGGYDSSYSSSGSSGASYSSGGASRSSSGSRPRWSRAGSSVSYTPAQVQSLTPIRQSAKPLRREQRSDLTFVTSSCATRGTTGKDQPKSCTIRSWQLVSRFGSARRTLA